MKNLIISLAALSISFSTVAQNEISDRRDKKTESKILFIEYKITSGEYKEAIQYSKSLENSLNKKPQLWNVNKVQAKLLQAIGFYDGLQFSKASDFVSQAISLSQNDNNDHSKFLSNLYLADYFEKTEDAVSALKYLTIAESILKQYPNTKNQNEFDLVKAKILLKQDLVAEALKLLNAQEAYRLEQASGTVSNENKEFINPKNDLHFQKERYGELLKLKSQAFIASGLYNEADKSFAYAKEWIGKNLDKRHPYIREILEMQGALSELKHDYSSATSYYTRAYELTPFPEYEQHKIRDLSRTTIACVQTDLTVKYKNYLRRLEMYAFRDVGFQDPFQLAFEYTEASKSFIEGDYTSASFRLNRLSEHFSFLPSSHPWSVDINALKSAIALKTGDIKGYKESFLKLSKMREQYYGNNSPAYHKALLALALYEINYGKDFAMAEKVMQTSYATVLKKEITRESKENITYMTAYAELFAKTDRYDSAMVKAQEAADITKNLYREKSPEYLLAFGKATEYQILTGKYKTGFENLQKAYDLGESVKEGDPEILQQAYMTLARLYSLKGEFDRSQSLLNRAYRLTLSGFEKKVLSEAETSEQLASLYLQTGNYFRAEKSLQKSLKVKESKLESHTPLLIHTYQELAKLNLVNGNYNIAEEYLSKASQISSEVFGKKSLAYGECLLIYSEYYLAIGDLKKAEAACVEADDIAVKKLGKENLRRADILARLAIIRSKVPTYKSTEIDKLYTDAGNVIKNSLGTDNPLYASLIQKQAEFYISIDKSDKAETLLNEASKFWTSKLGSDNKYVAEIEILKGNIVYNKSKYDQAEKNYSKARILYRNIFNESHPWYIQSSGKLARVYYMQKHPEKSLELMEEIIPKYLDYINKYFPSLSFREKSKFWNNIKDEFDFYNFIAIGVYNSQKPKLAGSVYNNIISTKALLLSSNIKIRERILSSKDSVLIELYKDWIAQKEYLTTIISLSKEQLVEQNIDLKYIESNIERLEKEMSTRSELFNDEDMKSSLTWKNIKETLTEGEYAVEIVRCRYFNKNFTDSVIYAALIINNKTEDYPEIALLPDGKMMEKKYYKYFRNAVTLKLNDKNSYNVYWKPIKAKIPDGATVYLSSDGIYNQLNVEMMPNGDGQYVLDKNQIVLVTNTKDLLKSSPKVVEKDKKKNTKESKKEALSTYVLCGNPDFYSGNANVEEEIVELPGAEKEVNDIGNLLVGQGKVTVKYIKDQVKEDTLRQLKNPKVFHIATHGFFKEAKNNDDEELVASPLLNSGLVVYGGGDILSNSENNYVNSKGGILTAYEAMNLSFDNTELVVLSACETGRGEVQVGEGVYGLQRSFLIAGADAVIMSLFKVNDEVTQKLMLSFYDKWVKTGDKRKAFIEAKKEIKQQYAAPIYWGVFVMIEGKPKAQSPTVN
jgi:CHAT domain-containing protein